MFVHLPSRQLNNIYLYFCVQDGTGNGIAGKFAVISLCLINNFNLMYAFLCYSRADEGIVFKKDLEGNELLRQSKSSNSKKKGSSITDMLLAAAAGGGGASNGTGETSSTSRGRKRERAQEEAQSLDSKRRKKQLLQSDLFDEEDEAEGGGVTAVLKLLMPLTLKKHMVDEWRILTSISTQQTAAGQDGQQPLLLLPRPLPVSAVLDEFLLLKKNKLEDEKMVSAVLVEYIFVNHLN
jgi:hypothetical protein